MSHELVYVVEVDHAGRSKVWAARGLNGYISTATQLLLSGLKDWPQDKTPTYADLIRAGRDANATYEVFLSPWHAACAIKTGKLSPDVETALGEMLTRHELVRKRDFIFMGGV